MARELTKTTTDHETIRRWAEARGGWPAEVAHTERDGDTGIIRIDFPGYSGEGSLKRITWDEWFDKFERSRLAFVCQDSTSGGERSNFNKLVARETAQARSRGKGTARTGARATRKAPERASARVASRRAKPTKGRASTRGRTTTKTVKGRASTRRGRTTTKTVKGRASTRRGRASSRPRRRS